MSNWAMAQRTPLDLEYGDEIRAKHWVACPQCRASTLWRLMSEFEEHVKTCRIIALGLAVDALKLPQLDELIPEKPPGWKWGR